MGVVCCFANAIALRNDSSRPARWKFQGDSEHSSAAVVVAILAVYELTFTHDCYTS